MLFLFFPSRVRRIYSILACGDVRSIKQINCALVKSSFFFSPIFFRFLRFRRHSSSISFNIFGCNELEHSHVRPRLRCFCFCSFDNLRSYCVRLLSFEPFQTGIMDICRTINFATSTHRQCKLSR